MQIGKRFFVKVFIFILIVGSLAGGCAYINNSLGLSDDNILEELTEEQINVFIGLEIDLSPLTPE